MKTNKDYMYLLEDSPEKMLHEINENIKEIIASSTELFVGATRTARFTVRDTQDILNEAMQEMRQTLSEMYWEQGRLERLDIWHVVNNYLENAELMGLIYSSDFTIRREPWGHWMIVVSAMITKDGPAFHHRTAL